MSPIFNFHRKYPKALKDLARETDRLAVAEDSIARSILHEMRRDDDETAEKAPSVAQVPPARSSRPRR